MKSQINLNTSEIQASGSLSTWTRNRPTSLCASQNDVRNRVTTGTTIRFSFARRRNISPSFNTSLPTSKLAYHTSLKGKSLIGTVAAATTSNEMPALSKKVMFKNSQGENLVGILEIPDESIGGHGIGVCVLCHGFRSTKESSTISALNAALKRAGISTFRFDFSGNGESEGTFEFGNYAKEVEDLRSAISYLREDEGRKVGTIAGHSKAGSVVLLYGVKYQDIPVIVNVSGRYHMANGVEERFGPEGMATLKSTGVLEQTDWKGGKYVVTMDSIRERMGTDMSVAKDVSAQVMTIHGSADDLIPVADAHEYEALGIPSHTLHIVDGADHNYSKHREEFGQQVTDFVILKHASN